MIPNIFSFELKYRFTNPLTYLILLMMAGQGIWYALGVYDYYTSDEALLNGAGIFYQCLAGGGMLIVAVVAMISGTTLHRDVAVGSADYVYACPLNEKRFSSGFWQITGATPAPTWVLQVPKLLAMFGTAFFFAFAIFSGGVFAQLLQGFWDIDLLLYITDIFGYKFGWITYIFNIILVFFLASLFGNRYLTHVVAIGYYLFMIISFEVGLIEQIRFGYALTPGVDDYSEMMGYGIWERSSFWFFLMWTSLATFFVLAGIQFWRRGTAQRIFDRKRLLGGELSFRTKTVGAAAMVMFFLLQGYIVASSNNLRNHISSEQADTEAALYEDRV